MSDGFYYDLVAARTALDEDKSEKLIREQVAKHFRSDHYTFDIINRLSVYFAPDGNPLEWGEPSDPYEVVPEFILPKLRQYPQSEWERVYGYRIEDETEEERLERAESAKNDADERFGTFVITRNMILDGVSLMPVSMQDSVNSHVFAVEHTGLDDIHVVDVALTGDNPFETAQPLVRSPRLDLSWLCHIDDQDIDHLNMFGDPYSGITDSNIPIEEGYWKYAAYTIPPQK